MNIDTHIPRGRRRFQPGVFPRLRLIPAQPSVIVFRRANQPEIADPPHARSSAHALIGLSPV